MGDAISVLVLLGYAAFVVSQYVAQCAEDRADRRSLRAWDAACRELSLPDRSVAWRDAPASPSRPSQANR